MWTSKVNELFDFRAWHIAGNRMYRVCALDMDRGQVVVNIDGQRMRGAAEAFVIMQSTTQRDRMQRLVYAGDILSHPRSSHPGVVVWHDGGFCVEIQAMPDAPDEDRGLFRGHMAVDSRVNECTILGNIFEDKQILDVRKEREATGQPNVLPTIWKSQS